MRPDLDDFDDMNQQSDGMEPRSRAMSWLVLGVAVTGFAALAYYAYQSGTRSLSDSNILEVAAEPGTIKDAPANPGGEEFPHQDKTIYDALTGDNENQKVEKLLPEPEEPVMPEPAVGKDSEAPKEKPAGKTTTYVNNDIADKEGEEDKFSGSPPNTEPVKPAPQVKTETRPAAAAPVPAPVAEAPKAAAAPAGDYKIQLGAYPSEEEAQADWKRISKKFSDTVSGSPIIVKADLPNGTFYRLRASGFASAAAAKAACAKLDAAKQPCFPAGK